EPLNPQIAEVVSFEDRFSPQVLEQLAGIGHHIQMLGPWSDATGHAQAIAIDEENKMFAGAADPRCDGLAMGY
ncbi:MAG: gamma-glutamyltransferase, partial [Candidatus Micrarchaeaceae archaeon]